MPSKELTTQFRSASPCIAFSEANDKKLFCKVKLSINWNLSYSNNVVKIGNFLLPAIWAKIDPTVAR